MHNEASTFNDSLGALCEFQNYDSISMQSSVVDSEFVASEIRRFEAQNQYSNPGASEQSNNNNQINLQISVIAPPIQESNLRQSNRNDQGFAASEKSSVFQQKSNNHIFQKPTTLICLITFICIVVGTVIGVIVVMNLKKEKDPITDESSGTSEPTTSFTSTSSSSTMSSTSEAATTTTTTEITTIPYVNPEPFDFFNRSEWKALPMKGRIKLNLPAKRIILMDTVTDPCHDVDDCKLFMQKRQNSSYLSQFQSMQIQDIPENFLIATDGTIFEGRGFSYEGQHTYDIGTSYNNDAIGISFIGNYSKNELSSAQKESFEYFAQKFVDEGNLEVDHLVYYKQQLIKSNVADDRLYGFIRTLEGWKESPKIIRRAEWEAASRSGIGDYLRKINTKAVIAHSGNVSCFELRECIDRLKQRQAVDKPEFGDIEHNFIFAGNDFIFEGRSYDISDSAGRGLEILFIGDFMNASPPQSLMNQLETFLNYSVDLGKLAPNYDILGEKQVEFTTSPGDKLYETLQKPPFDLHFNFNVSEAEKCSGLCGYF